MYMDRWGAVQADLLNDSRPSIVIANGRLEADSYANKMSLAQANHCLHPDIIAHATRHFRVETYEFIVFQISYSTGYE